MVMQLIAIKDFEEFTELPENAEKTLELIGGEIVEKMPSNPFCSYIAARILTRIGMYLLENDIGYVTGEAGAYRVGEDVYAPDVAFVSKAHEVELAKRGFNSIPPDLAIEVVSPTDSQRLLTRKIVRYLTEGIQAWVIYPEDFTVEIFVPGQKSILVGRDGVLTAPDILPGFELKVADIFPGLPPAK